MATKATPKKAAAPKKAAQSAKKTVTPRSKAKKSVLKHSMDALGRPIIRVENLATGAVQNIVLQDLIDFMQYNNNDTQAPNTQPVNTTVSVSTTKVPQRDSVILGYFSVFKSELSMLAENLRRIQTTTGFIDGNIPTLVPHLIMDENGQYNLFLTLDELTKYLISYRMAAADAADRLQNMI